MQARVLIADDDRGVRFTLREVLEDRGLSVLEAATGDAALELLKTSEVDLILSDQRMPGLSGLELLAEMGRLNDAPPLILLTAHGSERLAVTAMKAGAWHYLSKPFDPEELGLVVERALEQAALGLENRLLRAELTLARTMVFRSEAMRRIALMVERLARRDGTVLIQGETGTGKELVARAIVGASSRSEGPYIRFNCAALPRDLAEAELFGHTRGAYTGAQKARVGLVRQADGGTLLLDEIGELDPSLQGNLLRVLQEGEVRPVGSDKAVKVDVRILAATHRDLTADVEAGRFREDLYYRLNVVPLSVPPLRERPEDIVPLARHFARLHAKRFGVDPPRMAPRLLDHLRTQAWPGNVRELENAIERRMTLATGDVLDLDPLVDEPSVAGAGPIGGSFKERVAAFEKQLLHEALLESGGNRSHAARRLGMSRPTLIAKAQKYGLEGVGADGKGNNHGA